MRTRCADAAVQRCGRAGARREALLGQQRRCDAQALHNLQASAAQDDATALSIAGGGTAVSTAEHAADTRYLCVKFVVAQVQRRVDGLERLEVNVDLLLFALIGDDRAAVHHQTKRRH